MHWEAAGKERKRPERDQTRIFFLLFTLFSFSRLPSFIHHVLLLLTLLPPLLQTGEKDVLCGRKKREKLGGETDLSFWKAPLGPMTTEELLSFSSSQLGFTGLSKRQREKRRKNLSTVSRKQRSFCISHRIT